MNSSKINFLFLLVLFVWSQQVNGQATGEYRSRQSGDWTDIATWETFSGATWVAATHLPAFTSDVISILNGHVIAVNGNVTVSQVVVSNGGVLAVNAGLFTVFDGSGTDITCYGTFECNGGVLTGTGSIDINSGSTFAWNGAVIDGDVTLNINEGALFSIAAGDNVLGGATSPVINNYGECTWNNGQLHFGDGAPLFNNYGTLNIYTDDDVTASNNTNASFTNKTGGVMNRIGSPEGLTNFTGALNFTNEGTLNILSGNVRFLAPSIHTGILSIATGSTAYFSKTAAVFTSTSSIAGDGYLIFDGATTTLNSAMVSVKQVKLSADTLTVAANVHISSGVVFTTTNAVIDGNGFLNFDDGSEWAWQDGLVAGSGEINIAAGAQLNMDGIDRTLAQTKIVNIYGTANWNQGAIYYGGDKPVINNYGTFNINCDEALTDGDNSSGEFNNMPGGLINKTGNAEHHTNFYGSFSFVNSGVCMVNSGNIMVQVNSYHTGDIIINDGASVELRSDTTCMYAGTNITGGGELDCTGSFVLMEDVVCNVRAVNITEGTVSCNGTVLVSDGGEFNLSGGTLKGSGNVSFTNGSVFNWSSGVTGGDGLITINSDALLHMHGGTHYLTDTRQLVNYGIWSWDGGAVHGGDSITISNYGVLFMNSDEGLSLENAGSVFNNHPEGDIIKEGSDDGYSVIAGTGVFNNYGSTSIRSGNLKLAVDGEHSGRYDISSGGKLSGAIDLHFTGTHFINNGAVELNNLLLNGMGLQYLEGNGEIRNCIINNPSGVVVTDAQRITVKLDIAPNARLLVDKDLIVQGQ